MLLLLLLLLVLNNNKKQLIRFKISKLFLKLGNFLMLTSATCAHLNFICRHLVLILLLRVDVDVDGGDGGGGGGQGILLQGR